MNKSCERCGAEFVDRSATQHAKYCSVKCGQQSWDAAHPDAVLERSRKYREAHKDVLRERFRAWRAAHPEAKREQNRKYREAHPETVRESNRKWSAANPEAGRESAGRRRARKKEAFVEQVVSAAIYIRDNYTCQLCGKKVKMDKKFPHPLSPALDHILPLSKGGTHEPRNVQLAHLGCNARKGNTGVDQLRMFGI